MEREMRLRIYEKELRRLVLELRDNDCVIFEDIRVPDRYVQFYVHESAILGEVGLRNWMPESRGLRKTAVRALGCLGFEGGERRENFSRDHLPHDARRLACMTELLFGAAYGEDVFDMTPLVHARASTEAAAPSRRLSSTGDMG
jgi:hypothetical protein